MQPGCPHSNKPSFLPAKHQELSHHHHVRALLCLWLLSHDSLLCAPVKASAHPCKISAAPWLCLSCQGTSRCSSCGLVAAWDLGCHWTTLHERGRKRPKGNNGSRKNFMSKQIWKGTRGLLCDLVLDRYQGRQLPPCLQDRGCQARARIMTKAIRSHASGHQLITWESGRYLRCSVQARQRKDSSLC